jgi:hypothetical protein
MRSWLWVRRPCFSHNSTVSDHESPTFSLVLTAVSNAFPKRSGLVLGAITGAFDASSLPLVFYKLAYFAHGGKPDL